MRTPARAQPVECVFSSQNVCSSTVPNFRPRPQTLSRSLAEGDSGAFRRRPTAANQRDLACSAFLRSGSTFRCPSRDLDKRGGDNPQFNPHPPRFTHNYATAPRRTCAAQLPRGRAGTACGGAARVRRRQHPSIEPSTNAAYARRAWRRARPGRHAGRYAARQADRRVERQRLERKRVQGR